MNFRYILMFFVLISIMSCTTSSKKITDSQEYNVYLNDAQNTSLNNAYTEMEFWKQKLDKQPEQFPYLAKLAASYSNLFSVSGNIEYLKEAENNYVELIEITHNRNSSYLKGLSANYISQHKFKEALALLLKAEAIGDHLEGTQKMLFDVHLELGNYQLAKSYLDKFSDDRDFDYLIRVAKWSDHRGNLDAAIKYLEKAKENAEFANVKSSKQWVYTNLADFYGHHGNIQASYNHFLKALELNPNNAYAKKGIAWIVYSYEKNPDEALRILNAITKSHNSPDYYLLKAEIAAFKGDLILENQQINQYKVASDNEMYGDMYNKYNVLLFADSKEKINTALAIAQTEVTNRPTAQSYDLLAWTYFKKGQVIEALQIMENHVSGKTSEPEALYHLAEVYKANGKLKEAKELKSDLLESAFELGPIMEQKIKEI